MSLLPYLSRVCCCFELYHESQCFALLYCINFDAMDIKPPTPPPLPPELPPPICCFMYSLNAIVAADWIALCLSAPPARLSVLSQVLLETVELT